MEKLEELTALDYLKMSKKEKLHYVEVCIELEPDFERKCELVKLHNRIGEAA